MPWSPSYDDAVPDPRLDPYRNRAARLLDGGVTAGHVLVETDYRADLVSGALWWRRWDRPTEFAIVFVRIGDHAPTTTGVGSADLDLFERWSADGYVDQDRTLSVAWLDGTESQRVHDEVFAHQH